MFEPDRILRPNSHSSYVRHNLSRIAWDFVETRENRQRARYRDLLSEKQGLQDEHVELRGQCPSFRPVARALTREWFFDRGIEATDAIAGLLEDFQEAGGEVREMGIVMERLQNGLARLIEVRMKIVMLRDEVEQYRLRAGLLQMLKKWMVEEELKRVQRG